ncbi:hypothetical protein [Effusibacillus consociatus]|uniref:Uncharacterized protein n=1 Tax=Effusibacillus consociatus TaxID=1117041 RepID=A0ABV9PY93_9BACL
MSEPNITPGSKVYQLFNYETVVVEGKEERFIITIKKEPLPSSDSGPRAECG